MARARKTVETAPEETEIVTTEETVVKTRKPRTTSPLVTATRAYEAAVAKVDKLNDKIRKQQDLTAERDAAQVEATAAREALNALL